MKKHIFAPLAFTAALIFSCGEQKTEEHSNETMDASEVKKEEVQEPVVEEKGIVGVYTLTDMIPMTEGKKLTSQDEKYINESKERTIGNTTLALKDDGSFERVFPHPSGNGTTKSWTGKYEYMEADGKLMLNAEMNGKLMPMEFKIEEMDNEKLAISTEFGQIFMNYVYTRK